MIYNQATLTTYLERSEIDQEIDEILNQKTVGKPNRKFDLGKKVLFSKKALKAAKKAEEQEKGNDK